LQSAAGSSPRLLLYVCWAVGLNLFRPFSEGKSRPGGLCLAAFPATALTQVMLIAPSFFFHGVLTTLVRERTVHGAVHI